MKKIEINATNEIHILRHFQYVEDSYSETLIGQSYHFYNYDTSKFENGIITEENIRNALETKGSKFFKNIKGIENPEKLLKLIRNEFESKEVIDWDIKKDNKFFSFLINYHTFVGNKNLIKIDLLTEAEKLRVQQISRGKDESVVFINVVKGAETQKLKTIEVAVHDAPSIPFLLVTAYPGNMYMTEDFPNKNQTEEEYKKSKEFWDNHVFVE